MSSFDGRSAVDQNIPTIKKYPGVGEIVAATSDTTKTIFTALCLLDHPVVNQYLLDCKLKLQDRITKTKIFPRDGMALPDGETYKEPDAEELTITVVENN